MSKIHGLFLELRYHSDKINWSLYLFREDGLGGKPIEHSTNLPGVPGEEVARQWADFLGLHGFDTSGK